MPAKRAPTVIPLKSGIHASFRFFAGERIHTEHSHKYDAEGFRALAREAGWRPQDMWTDAERLFSVHMLSAG